MRSEKLLRAALGQRSTGTGPTVFALLAGLAVGAVLGVLFAPESGEEVRRKIATAAKGVVGNSSEEGDGQEDEEQDDSEQKHTVAKKPKSDIKSLLHEAHVSGAQHGE